MDFVQRLTGHGIRETELLLIVPFSLLGIGAALYIMYRQHDPTLPAKDGIVACAAFAALALLALASYVSEDVRTYGPYMLACIPVILIICGRHMKRRIDNELARQRSMR